MLTLPGTLFITTISGRYGPFNVGRLSTEIGEFAVKNRELEQYKAGRYEGDFVISQIRPAPPYTVGSRLIIEIRAELQSMTLSGVDALSKDDERRSTPQEPDPLEEERRNAALAASAKAEDAGPKAQNDPLIDTTPFATTSTRKPRARKVEEVSDESLFTGIWPLQDVVKLDATVDRGLLRRQCARLELIGYGFEPLSQDWHRKAA